MQAWESFKGLLSIIIILVLLGGIGYVVISTGRDAGKIFKDEKNFVIGFIKAILYIFTSKFGYILAFILITTTLLWGGEFLWDATMSSNLTCKIDQLMGTEYCTPELADQVGENIPGEIKSVNEFLGTNMGQVNPGQVLPTRTPDPSQQSQQQPLPWQQEASTPTPDLQQQEVPVSLYTQLLPHPLDNFKTYWQAQGLGGLTNEEGIGANLIPNGVVGKIWRKKSLMSGWPTAANEKWAMTLIYEKDQVEVSMNGLMGRALTGGIVPKEDTPATIHGSGNWPEECFDKTGPTSHDGSDYIVPATQGPPAPNATKISIIPQALIPNFPATPVATPTAAATPDSGTLNVVWDHLECRTGPQRDTDVVKYLKTQDLLKFELGSETTVSPYMGNNVVVKVLADNCWVRKGEPFTTVLQ